MSQHHGYFPDSDYESGYCYFNPYYDVSTILDDGNRAFRYLYKELAQQEFDSRKESAQFAKTIADLNELGQRMLDGAPEDQNNSDIPAGYTYWGQFIDHDITAGTDRSHRFRLAEAVFAPIAPDNVEADLRNMRTPQFDLDSVYGDCAGPDGVHRNVLYGYQGDIAKLRIGRNAAGPGTVPPPAADLDRDLPRNTGRMFLPDEAQFTAASAVVGDERNDENLVIAQFHLGILRFHNAVVDIVRGLFPHLTDSEVFQKARREVIRHYQYLIFNDYLRHICDPDIVDRVIDEARAGNSIFAHCAPFMPLEFSTAAFRFGHSMVRNRYDFNRNFGRNDVVNGTENHATFVQLFQFTGGGDILPEIGALPHNWIIEWDRFFDHDPRDAANNLLEDRFSRKFDTVLAVELSHMENAEFEDLADSEKKKVPVTAARFNTIMNHLAKRNLLRGYLLSMPTGQAIANAEEGIDPLNEDEILTGEEALDTFLQESGFSTATPLWYYILREAKVKADGKHLGALGSLIVARTFVGILAADTTSVFNTDWKPGESLIVAAEHPEITDMMALFRFAGVLE